MRISDWGSDVCASDLGAGAGDRAPAARPGTGCTRECRGWAVSEQRLLTHARRPLVHLSLCALHAQLVIRVEAGVEGEEFVEHRGEEEQVALTDEAVLVHGQFGTYAAHWQPAMQAIDVLVGNEIGRAHV